MTNRVHIRVSMEGNQPKWELMHDGLKITELSFIEVLELAMQATSSLRWIPRKLD
ncbi:MULTISPECIES: hypothetical protein [Chelativorans]|jgi:hypothetical protein|uniref:hypothetical protein n=1 Tax=Chelativorans TaxID=449972 RepID=UPI00003A3690|nr:MULTISPECIES: hypothetical protein [Chelativorans]